mmetsp:Transcript_26012/g.57443  ORF Transcript_26012/g.57443 Transcript_26012/m.57443 type:complete len:95 (+) Transcript_26012:146-430(+)
MIECNAGYSTTGMFSGARNFTIRCEYDGELTGFKSCKNINDCAAPWGVTCNDKGTCQDHASPTGVHLDDRDDRVQRWVFHDRDVQWRPELHHPV